MFVVHPELEASERGVHVVDIHADTSLFLLNCGVAKFAKQAKGIGSTP